MERKHGNIADNNGDSLIDIAGPGGAIRLWDSCGTPSKTSILYASKGSQSARIRVEL